MIFLTLIIIGSLVGFLSTFFGMGGGILIIPIFYTLFSFLPAQVVIGTSLTFMFFNSTRNLFHFRKAGTRPNYKFLLPVATSMFIAVIIAGRTTFLMEEKTIKLLFSVYIFFIAIKTLLIKHTPQEGAQWMPTINIKSNLLGIFTGTASGLVIGLGGGAILIPLLISIQKIPLKYLSVNTNACSALGAFAGMLTYFLHPTPTFVFNYPLLEMGQLGYVNFTLVFALLIGATLSSRLGVKWSQRANPRITRRLFVSLLLVISIKTFVSSQIY